MWWLNFNPQFNWPFSGSVVQDIHPSLLARAGNDETELRVLREVASYGRQIGVLSDLVLGLAKRLPAAELDDDARHALDQLEEMASRIERIKQGQAPLPPTADQARSQLQVLLAHYPELVAAVPAGRKR
jgi:hypothetical protein